MNDDSILTSIKKLLGIASDYQQFDTDIIMNINSSFAVLNQLGVGPEGGFTISDSSTTWNEFLGDNKKLEMAKMYCYLRCRLIFDPPQSSAVTESINNTIHELEWRLTVVTDEASEVSTG